MVAAELRMVFGKNIIDLTDEELDQACRIAAANGLKIISIASPLLKCVLPDAPEVDARFQQDMFASRQTIADQPRLTARAFQIARKTGAAAAASPTPIARSPLAPKHHSRAVRTLSR